MENITHADRSRVLAAPYHGAAAAAALATFVNEFGTGRGAPCDGAGAFCAIAPTINDNAISSARGGTRIPDGDFTKKRAQVLSRRAQHYSPAGRKSRPARPSLAKF